MDKKYKQADIVTKTRAYLTNAATEIKETITEGQIPYASDEAVEEARDWVNNGSQL
ncbi:MAG TPA: hypothetical protein GXZ22_08430 [Clostridiaceae bacterium]|jgi:hypothetical protein|nr:hypothetical protein [Clostridiaceae bacterium]